MGDEAFLTDQYEFTALRAALRSGVADRPAVFELFCRRLPPGRRYGVVAGVQRAVEAVASFALDQRMIAFLAERGVADDALCAYLDGWRFTGTISAYEEGELYFPHSPVLRVEAPFGQATLAETVLLSALNADSAVAAAASRMAVAARGRPLVEMGSRRTHEQAAVDAARAAYIAGFAGTSNLAAGWRHGVPTVGTSMHAFTLAHDTEADAFRAQIAALGAGTTLLVDTYDIEQGIRNAVAAAREAGADGPGAVRIDSGVLRDEVPRARALLDALGARDTKITVTSDLDEYAIDEMAADPVDTFGVGTRLVGGSGAPTAGFVYKLVAVGDGDGGWRPVAKRSASKASVGGAKTPYRVLDGGVAVAERYSLAGRVPPDARPLQQTFVLGGEVVHRPALGCLRDHHRRSLAEMRPEHLTVQAGEPAMTAEPEEGPR